MIIIKECFNKRNLLMLFANVCNDGCGCDNEDRCGDSACGCDVSWDCGDTNSCNCDDR